MAKRTTIDVIIATVKGREELLARCIESYGANSPPGSLTFIIIHDEPTCGLAWQKGIALSRSPYVHLSCDDLKMVSPTWSMVCMEAVAKGKIPAPIVRRPDGSIESCGGDMSASACLISEMQEDWTEVDFSTVPFGSREQIKAIGMTDGHYETDTYFSHKGRKLGWPTVVRHGYEFIHHHSEVKRISPNMGDHRVYTEAMEAA